jgi:segregation and condensation protein B
MSAENPETGQQAPGAEPSPAPPPAESPAPGEAPAADDAPRAPQGPLLVAAIEALLFSTTQPIRIETLAGLLNTTVENAAAGLERLRVRLDDPESGLMLVELAGGHMIATRRECAPWILQMHEHRRRNPITPAVLETLAIIAYKQPVSRAEIEAIRGVDCGAVLRSLQDAELIDVVGRRETPGRPAIYGTTEMFLKTFGLRTLQDLPVPGA